MTSMALAQRRQARAKRIFDVVTASTGLVVTAPLLAAAAIAVRIESGPPVIFRQERVGRGGRPFRIHKFRTMRAGPGPLISSTHDPRITRVGSILRRTKLDELPQLIDVLVGNMSLVGPRPEVPSYVALWPAAEREIILSSRPGITDPAAVLFHNEQDELAAVDDPEDHYVNSLLPRKVAMYVAYVQNQSLTLDLKILVSTLRVVAAGRSAVTSQDMGPG